MEIEHGWLLLLYFCFVIGRGSGETEFYTTAPPRQYLYLELSSRLSKRQKAQERLYDKLPQQSLVTSRTGMLIDCSLSSLVSLTCREILIWCGSFLAVGRFAGTSDTQNSCTFSTPGGSTRRLPRSTFCFLHSCGFQSRQQHHPLANVAPVLTPTLASGGH